MTPELINRITLIPGFNPGPYTGTGNNTYLIGGREPVLIDTATGKTRHLEALTQALKRQTSRLARVLVTHGHPDHASGAEAIAQRWPGTPFAKMSWPERDQHFPVDWLSLRDGDVVAAGDTQLRAVHTPGHAPDHLCFFEEESRILFCGDLVIKGNTVVIPSSHGGNLSEYLSSLRRTVELAPTKLLPGHGPEIDDPAELITEYLDHRRRREDQIVAALADGCLTVEAIVGRVYLSLSAGLVPAASESVLAHLIKLRDEGRVRENTDSEWALI